MQIDFHHGVTYVVARLAGFGHREAETIAYCAQYVDDATNGGVIEFTNQAMYSRIYSAHKGLDYRHFDKLSNHHVWIPFHFLPGNGGKRAGENPQGSFIEKIICRSDSYVAKDMLLACIRGRNEPLGLHRLGITMHVYADTWAHEGFAGVNHVVNDVKALDDQDEPDPGFLARLEDFFGDQFDRAAGRFVGDSLPLGHGAALSYPDRPYLRWRYRDSRGVTVVRDNPVRFVKAAQAMCIAMQRYMVGRVDAEVPGLSVHQRGKLGSLFETFKDTDGALRHRKWLEEIARGAFGFPPVRLAYKAKGVDSWKYQAIGTRRLIDKKSDRFTYDPSFLGSDWKLFHDALEAHRFEIIKVILPRYGICAA
ncbi:MAG: DUF6765 family protein [Thermodesulfobacteriota bacterium]|nr:DUF6765 family protein [Thermodesulfobacteriota bacterium]